MVDPIRVSGFGGMVPAVDDRLLPPNAASNSENTWPFAGTLIGLPSPVQLYQCAGTGIGKVYRLPLYPNNPEYLWDSIYLEFESMDTDVVHAPVFGDTHDRYYWASPAHAPKYNSRARIDNGDNPYLLGIPQPGSLSITVTGGSGSDVTRSYVCTWVSVFGEEGPPSAPLVKTGKTDGSWDITLPSAAAGDLDGTDRDLTYVRIYRTVTSGSGITTFFFVAEQDITDTSYSDTASDSTVASHDQLISTNWTSPPADLQGFCMMPNGVLAGWRANEVWLSEPYRPHAWPVSYVMTFEKNVVGLGVAGQTLVVCTQGAPARIYGSHPAFFGSAVMSLFEPCMARGSIVSAPEGVYYASPNGLVLVTEAGTNNITREVVPKAKWNLFTRLSALRAARLSTAYYGFGSARPGVFSVAFEPTAFAQSDYSAAREGILLDPMTPRLGINLLSSDGIITNVFNDPWTGEVFILKDDVVYWLPQDDPSRQTDVFVWKSKVFETPKPGNFGAVKIYFNVPDSTPAQSVSANDILNQSLVSDQYGLVRFYADGRHIATRELRTSGQLIRLPKGFKATAWQFEIEARVEITSVHMAGGARELAQL